MDGTCNVTIVLISGALGRDQKVKYHNISITKSITKIFKQTLSVFSQMKDIKHIRQYSPAVFRRILVRPGT